ncbi:hypothetical protein [Haloplanus natans]|uniref:hypothetical protein n=1 Tax=Haloplanus natans TaxID=376171 RepID=UPI0006781A39|nr:hypothetical protein [Haloplanus natans]
MVSHELDDGVRIAQLLASDLVGHEDGLAAVTVTDADPEVEPTADGTRAYRVRAADRPLASVFVHPDRARIEFEAGQEAALDAAREAGLRVRPKLVDPPRTVIFVENGAEVKRALGVVEAVVESRD